MIGTLRVKYFLFDFRTIIDNLVVPLQERMEDWKKTVAQLDKEHTKGTVKFINFRTQENFAVIILKLEKRGFTIE